MWKISDVESHKKGLSPEQKKRWVSVANSILAKCIKDGGSDSSCAPTAIRQANSVVANNQLYVNTSNTNYTIREEIHQGRKHIVVPVVMMVEGVHNGSMGPLLHTAEELGKYPESWNGIPVVINHPVNNEGDNISANSPEIIDSEVTVGKVYHTHLVDTKLMAEAYLDEEKLNNISSNALLAIMNGDPLEVSIGVFNDTNIEPGQWHNEKYNAVAINHRPDHLALLPGGIGACSWEDGCGVRVNQKKKGGKNMVVDDAAQINEEKQKHIQSILDANMDQGYRYMIESAQNMLNKMDSENAYHYLEDMDNTHVIYSKRDKNDRKMLKQSYEINESGVPTLINNPIEVRQKIDYVPVVTHMVRSKFNVNKGGKAMNNKEECGQCMEKVVAIINSNAAGMTAENREWLLTQDEPVLDMLLSKKPVEKKVEVSAKLTSDQILDAMSAEDKAALAFGRKQLADKRANMIKGIQDNTEKDLWPEAVLNTLSEDFLEKLYNSVNVNNNDDVEANYALNGNSHRMNVNFNDEEALYPVGVEIETTK